VIRGIDSNRDTQKIGSFSDDAVLFTQVVDFWNRQIMKSFGALAVLFYHTFSYFTVLVSSANSGKGMWQSES